MYSVEDLSILFENHIQTFTFTDSPLGQSCQYIIRQKGKRVRPLLCLLSHSFFAPINDTSFIAGVILELFHNFTLVHDDIMDCATLRRGMPTIVSKEGTNKAILVGDILLVYAYQLIEQLPPSISVDILKLLNKAGYIVCEGQQEDLFFETQTSVSMEAYLSMIEKKTASLIGISMQMGGIVGSASSYNLDLLYQIGIDIGIVFQIQDDYLDMFGDEQLGKRIGGDIIQKKKTFLSIYMMELISKQKEPSDFFHYFQLGDVSNTILTYKKANIEKVVANHIQRYWYRIIGNIDQLQIDLAYKNMFKEWIDKLYKRKK